MRWSFILLSLLSLSLSSSVLSTPIPGRGGGGSGRSSRSSSPAPSHSRSNSPAPAVHKSSPPAHNPSTHNSRSSSPAPPAHNSHPPSRSSSPGPSHDDKKKTPPSSRPASPGPGTHAADKSKGKEPPPRRQQPSRKDKEKGMAKTSQIAKDEADPKPKKWTPKHTSKKYREAAKDAPWSVNPSTKDPKQWTLAHQKDGVKREPKKGEHADHVFEAQMLKKGLQKGGVDWHSLSKEHQNGIKNILNGKENMQFIPGNVNMAKGRRVTSSLRPTSSKNKQAADPNSKNSLRKKKRQDAAQQNPKKTKTTSADPVSVTNYMKSTAPIAGHTAHMLDQYLTNNQIHSKPLMAPLLEDTYRKQGIIGKTDSIPALPAKP